jgi:diadenosine tetraphosphate (Ap4A) HIT family hydrolase
MSCLLCEQLGGDLVWQDEACRVVLPSEPGYPGFVRVIAQQHVAEMTDLSAAQRARVMSVVWTCEAILRRVMQPAKVNLASLGNMVPHLHWHVIARFGDDAHFPGSVWSEPQREVSATCLAQWQAAAQALPLALRETLMEVTS